VTTRAYVLIKAEAGKVEAAQRQLQGRPGIRSAEIVVGAHDIIALVEAADLNGIGKLVLTEIHGVGGVANTLTCPVVQPAVEG
jgi:DNA-binding Lrp family transcriptional regulator